jgi:hypothetical protein
MSLSTGQIKEAISRGQDGCWDSMSLIDRISGRGIFESESERNQREECHQKGIEIAALAEALRANDE